MCEPATEAGREGILSLLFLVGSGAACSQAQQGRAQARRMRLSSRQNTLCFVQHAVYSNQHEENTAGHDTPLQPSTTNRRQRCMPGPL